MDRHHLVLHEHHVLYAQHRKQRMKAAKRHIVRCGVWICALAPMDELSIAARDPRIVAPSVKRSHRHRRIRIPKVENAVVAGMRGEEVAQLRDNELRAVKCRALRASKREYLSDSERSEQKNGTAFGARPERQKNGCDNGKAGYQRS